jgi:serine/threonine protein phosphatase 1|tara:strand:+ start:1484 stop:2209 length:726 start_codon:yes stop_codon:yes gene_type:complete
VNNYSQIFVVGDIHGCHILLAQIHKKILDKSNNTSGNKLLVYLGDYIDRGPKIKETIQALLDFQPDNFQQIFLLGNHEQMMLDFINNVPDSLYLWMLNGGDETLNSYGIKDTVFFNNETKSKETIRGELVNNIPKNHLKFFHNLTLSYKWGDYFFVHAGIDPDVPLNKQDKNTLIWQRKSKFLDNTKLFEKIIVHGHTPQPKIENLANRINLDTGAFYTGILSCLIINTKTGEKKFISTKN